MDDDYLLQENEDYTITYSDNIKVGTATVMITGMGRYTGTVSASFTIQQVKKNNVIKVIQYYEDSFCERAESKDPGNCK